MSAITEKNKDKIGAEYSKKNRRSKILPGFFLIFLTALLFRFVILLLLRHSGYSLLPVLDAASYDQWASEIVSGDWLARAPYYQDPLYPYLSAIIYRVIGYHPETLRVIQIVWGSISCVLIASIAKRLFNVRASGLVAGFAAALCGPLAFYDLLLLKTSLGIFLISLMLYLLIGYNGNKLVRVFSVGLCLGLTALVRANMFVFFPVVIIYLGCRAYNSKSRYPGVLKSVGIFILGVALAIMPFTLANLKAGGEFILTTSQLGSNLYQGNNVKIVSTGRYSPPDFLRADPRFEAEDYGNRARVETGRKMTPLEVSAYWSGQAWEFMTADLSRFVSYTLKKVFVLLNGYEVPDNYNIYMASQKGGVPFLTWIGWPLFLVVGLAGMALSLFDEREKGKIWLLMSFFILYSLSLIVFFTFARYRLPLYIPLLVFSGAAVSNLLENPRRLYKPSVAICIFAGGLVGFWPVEKDNQANEYLNRAVVQFDRGDIQAAEKNLLEALKISPSDGKVLYNLGSLYLRQRKFEEAEKHLTRAASLLPQDWSVWNNLGIAFRQNDKISLAVKSHREALNLSPQNPEILVNLALCYSALGESDRAVETLKTVTELDPDRASAFANLGVILAGQKNYLEAEPYLLKADNLEPGNMMILGNLAEVKNALGKTGEAIGIYERMLKQDNGRYRARIMRSLEKCYLAVGDSLSAKRLSRSYPTQK